MNELCSPIPTATLLKLAQANWAESLSVDYKPNSLEPYGAYYTEQCKTIFHSLSMGLPFSKHDDIIILVQDIRQGLTRQHIIENLERRHPTTTSNTRIARDDILNRTVDLAARLLLMTDVGRPSQDRIWTERTWLCWEQGNIREFTSNVFPARIQTRHDGVQLDADFNARNLNIIGGLKVELTSNLLDHLKVDERMGDTTVMIFHHASFLKNQDYPLFPDGFVKETLQTLALLFPQNRWYKECRSWYEKHLQPALPDADLAVLQCGPLTMTDISEYRFWHDRLVRLKLVLDQSKPRTLRQWWNDRREGQWYALWIAVGFTIFFGLVQSIEGALQVYKAFQPNGS